MELQLAEDAIKARLAAQDRQYPLPPAVPTPASLPPQPLPFNAQIPDHFPQQYQQTAVQQQHLAANKRLEPNDEHTPFGTDRNAKVRESR